eukprot:TRINITY_DN66950_c5_g1_i1.p2 TRINITY_DN66950_c5_g1~~TRINITY_DN66950_c5_g1_i1.p2  ORF type:complete len:115 (-),score=11.59 TRINITY_DN66950_c5_g1_i1:1802-2146(-)
MNMWWTHLQHHPTCASQMLNTSASKTSHLVLDVNKLVSENPDETRLRTAAHQHGKPTKTHPESTAGGSCSPISGRLRPVVEEVELGQTAMYDVMLSQVPSSEFRVKWTSHISKM